MKWGVCTTAKATLEQILAFVAWHRDLGAAHIWVHIDDADVAIFDRLAGLDFVTPVLCDRAYWQVHGFRPKAQERRQLYNIQRVYDAAPLPVIAHLDVDEFLYPARPMLEILVDWPGDDPFIRAVPAEAMHDPNLPDDINTARLFRLPYPSRTRDLDRLDLLGPYAHALPTNMLSHRAGKSLFRTGVPGLMPRLHIGRIGPDRACSVNLPFHPDLTVLHFHAQDRAAWRAALPHRLTKGAYRFNEPLAAFLNGADAAEVDAFYEATQVAHPDLVDRLRDRGLLIEADLQLRERVAALPR